MWVRFQYFLTECLPVSCYRINISFPLSHLSNSCLLLQSYISDGCAIWHLACPIQGNCCSSFWYANSTCSAEGPSIMLMDDSSELFDGNTLVVQNGLFFWPLILVPLSFLTHCFKNRNCIVSHLGVESNYVVNCITNCWNFYFSYKN